MGEEVEISSGIVKLKKLKYGEANELIAQVIGKVRVMGGEVPQVEIDLAKYRELLLLKSIESAPFAVTLESIRNLSQEDGEKLFRKAQELNPFLTTS